MKQALHYIKSPQNIRMVGQRGFFKVKNVRPRKNKGKELGPVVRRPINAKPGLSFYPGFFFFYSKAFPRIIFSIFFKSWNHHIEEKKLH